MKFSVEREPMLAAVTKARAIIESRNTIAILSNIRLTASGSTVAIRATDLDMQLDTIIPAEVEGDGTITVPCQTAYDILRSMPKTAVISFDLNAEETQVAIKSGRAKLALNALPSRDYPDLEAGEFSHSFKIAKADLTDLFQGTHFAVSTEETRYYLNGVYFQSRSGAEGDELRACATDGHRLALICKAAPEGSIGFPGVILPTKTVASVMSMMSADEIAISLSTAKIKFDFGASVLLSKVIDGTFPDYERVIPNGNERRLRIDREALIAGVSRCAALGADGRGHLIRLDLEGECATLSVISADRGNAREEIDADFESDAPLTIGVNSKYLLSIAERLDADQLLFKFADPGSPIIVKTKDGAQDTAVIMPMRV